MMQGAGFQKDTNKITIFNQYMDKTVYAVKSKTEVAKDICTEILKLRKAPVDEITSTRASPESCSARTASRRAGKKGGANERSAFVTR